jgi:hypothetical protein
LFLGSVELDPDSLLRSRRIVSGDLSDGLIKSKSRIQRPPSGGLLVCAGEVMMIGVGILAVLTVIAISAVDLRSIN